MDVGGGGDSIVFLQGTTRADLENHLMFYYAVAKAIELIGEAASHVSAASQSEYGGIDWDQIVGMRHHLVHNFHRIDNDILWEAVQDDMPILIAQLQVALTQREG